MLIGATLAMAMPALAEDDAASPRAAAGATQGMSAGARARAEAIEPPPAMPSAITTETAAPTVTVQPVPGSSERPSPTYHADSGGFLSGLTEDEQRSMQPAGPIHTLRDAIARAYHTNPDLLAARGQARSTDFQVPAARSAYGPTLIAQGNYTLTRTRVEVLPGTYEGAQGWATSASLILNQPLFTFGRNSASVAGAVATSEFQRASLRLTEAQVLNNVVTAYVAVLRDATSVSIARENLSLLNRQLEEVQTRYMVRDLTLTDLDQTRTRVELGRAQLLQAEGQLGASQKVFLRYIGAPPGELAPPDVLNVNFPSLADAYAYGETNSGLIRAAQAREKISRANSSAARAELRPRVDARGTFNYGSTSPFNDNFRQTNIVGQLVVSQTLFDSGLRSARIGQAREANESDWRLVDESFRETRQTIGTSWDQLAALRSSLDRYRTAIAAAQRAYDGALIQQKTGDRSTLDVLDLARDLLTVRNAYNSAVADEYLARASLLAASGLLEAPSIIPEIERYDAEEHYDRVRDNGDIPLFTPLMSAVDGIVVGDQMKDRPSRDDGARQALDARMPLPPPPATEAPTVP